jgi:hypothetical protein
MLGKKRDSLICVIFFENRSKIDAVQAVPFHPSTRRSSKNAITRRAPAISSSAGCHDAPPNGVEMPVNRFAISENFIGFRLGC